MIVDIGRPDQVLDLVQFVIRDARRIVIVDVTDIIELGVEVFDRIILVLDQMLFVEFVLQHELHHDLPRRALAHRCVHVDLLVELAEFVDANHVPCVHEHVGARVRAVVRIEEQAVVLDLGPVPGGPAEVGVARLRCGLVDGLVDIREELVDGVHDVVGAAEGADGTFLRRRVFSFFLGLAQRAFAGRRRKVAEIAPVAFFGLEHVEVCLPVEEVAFRVDVDAVFAVLRHGGHEHHLCRTERHRVDVFHLRIEQLLADDPARGGVGLGVQGFREEDVDSDAGMVGKVAARRVDEMRDAFKQFAGEGGFGELDRGVVEVIGQHGRGQD